MPLTSWQANATPAYGLPPLFVLAVAVRRTPRSAWVTECEDRFLRHFVSIASGSTLSTRSDQSAGVTRSAVTSGVAAATSSARSLVSLREASLQTQVLVRGSPWVTVSPAEGAHSRTRATTEK